MKRVKLKSSGGSKKPPKNKGGGKYFDDEEMIERFSSGCRLLDRALGGGWAHGRFINIVGDKSTGKTQQAVESMANFARKFPNGRMRYRDAEWAFDVPYAERIGLPKDRVELGDEEKPFDTVEDFFADVTEFLDTKPKDVPGLYILDALDALSDDSEMKRDETKRDPDQKGTYGTGKSKAMSRFFRKLTRRLGRESTTLIIISQVRENINAMFGEKYYRTGGKALDFYASQIVWLAHLGMIKKTRKGVERPIGVHTRAKVKKNKTGRPFREADFPILFDFGVEDLWAGLDFLIDVKRTDLVGMSKDAAAKAIGKLDKMSDEEYRSLRKSVSAAVDQAWDDIEETFTPSRRKYD